MAFQFCCQLLVDPVTKHDTIVKPYSSYSWFTLNFDKFEKKLGFRVAEKINLGKPVFWGLEMNAISSDKFSIIVKLLLLVPAHFIS